MLERLLIGLITFDLGPQSHSHKLSKELTFSTVLKLQAPPLEVTSLISTDTSQIDTSSNKPPSHICVTLWSLCTSLSSRLSTRLLHLCSQHAPLSHVLES